MPHFWRATGLARRALIEAAWTPRYPASISETLRARLEGSPKHRARHLMEGQGPVCALVIVALSTTGKKLPGLVVAALAREMAAGPWSHWTRGRASVGAATLSRSCAEPGVEHERWGTPVASYVAGFPSGLLRPLDRGKPRDEDTAAVTSPRIRV